MTSVDLTKSDDEFYDTALIITDHENIDYELVTRKAKLVLDTRNIIKKLELPTSKLWTA